MRTIIVLLFLNVGVMAQMPPYINITLMTGSQHQPIFGERDYYNLVRFHEQAVFTSTGDQPSAIFAQSFSGSPAAFFQQDIYFDLPVLTLFRNGTQGGAYAGSPVLQIKVRHETRDTDPVFQIVRTHIAGGVIFLYQETTIFGDGSATFPGTVTAAALTATTVKATSKLVVPRSWYIPPANPEVGQIYFNTHYNRFYGWNGSAWKPLDN